MSEDLPRYAVEFRGIVGDGEIGAAAKKAGIRRGTAEDFYHGRAKKLENIGVIARFKVWSTFKLESFYDEVFEPISSADTYQIQLQKFIFKNYNGSVAKCADDVGIHASTIHGFFAGRTKGFKPDIEKKIREKVKIPYFGNYEEGNNRIEKEAKKPEALENRIEGDIISMLSDTRDALNKLSRRVSKEIPNSAALKVMKQQYSPDLEQRLSTVENAFLIIADELDYFREASDEERKKLARRMDPEVMGYVLNLLETLSQKDGYQTFFRTFSPPSRKKLKRRN
jgi:hypothetical protein